MKKNNQLDKMAQQFSSIEELQAYSEAQYKTILNLNTKINDLNKQLEIVAQKNGELVRQLAVAENGGSKDSNLSVSDEEATCVIQIAMIKINAMQRELLTDEVKRFEILAKTLHMLRGKEVDQNKKKEEKELAKMSSAELLEYMDKSLKDPQ
jgi:hypothetical protein